MSEVIVITSGKGGVGKTTTSANVGTEMCIRDSHHLWHAGGRHIFLQGNTGSRACGQLCDTRTMGYAGILQPCYYGCLLYTSYEAKLHLVAKFIKVKEIAGELERLSDECIRTRDMAVSYTHLRAIPPHTLRFLPGGPGL